MRAALCILLLLGCTPTIPGGRLACATAADCPPGWSCFAGRCHGSAVDASVSVDASRDSGADAGLDSGAMDAGLPDGGFDAATPDGGLDAATPDAGLPVRVVDVEAGGFHVCAIADGRLHCWGSNLAGQLGRPGDDSSVPTPIDVGGPVELLSVGQSGACVVVGGVLSCWGENGAGEVGDGTTTTRDTPTVVGGGWTGTITNLSRGWASNCLTTSSDELFCWGNHQFLGLGAETSPALSPIRLFATELAGMTSLRVATFGPNCVASASGLHCWGGGANGGNGDGSTMDRLTPVPVMGVAGAVAEVHSGAFHACLRELSGATRCWGHNPEGEVGDGTTDTPVTSPVPIAGIDDARQLTVGHQHSCVRRSDATVWCWGRNDFGEVGDGTTTDRSIPVAVSLPAAAVDVSAGGFFTCAALVDGRLFCWGNNGSGQLGDGTTVDSTTPVQVTFP